MSETESDRPERRWIQYTREDLAATLNTSLLARQRCLFAQQAAEKGIKGLLVRAGLEYPYSHDLNYLRTLIPDGLRSRDTLPDMGWLTIWAIRSRYPVDFPEATNEEAERAASEARAVIEIIEQDLAEDPHPAD